MMTPLLTYLRYLHTWGIQCVFPPLHPTPTLAGKARVLPNVISARRLLQGGVTSVCYLATQLMSCNTKDAGEYEGCINGFTACFGPDL